MTGVLYFKKGNFDTDTGREIAREDEDTDEGDVPTRRGMPQIWKVLWWSPEAGREAWHRFFLPALRRNQPTNTWILNFQPLCCKRINCCCLNQSTNLWHFEGSPRKLRHHTLVIVKIVAPWIMQIFQMWAPFITGYQKPHLFRPSQISLEKPLSAEKLPTSQWQTQVFQNCHFHLKAQILSLK